MMTGITKDKRILVVILAWRFGRFIKKLYVMEEI